MELSRGRRVDYARSGDGGVAEELIDTGIQRLVGDLDELSHPVLGYRLLEPPSRATTLTTHALPASQVRRYSPIGSLVLTFGCKFACPFFFGADDNFFNHEKRTLDIVEMLARVRTSDGGRCHRFRWATEVTVHDTLKLQKHLPLTRKAGVRSLWLGVEDMTATLIRKGQSVDKTSEAFRLLREDGIHPMPMTMHHDEQPLISFGPRPCPRAKEPPRSATSSPRRTNCRE